MYKEVERFIDQCIPVLVIVLGLIIILDLTTGVHQFEPWITYADWVIVTVFVIDLVFKWRHVRNVKKFVRLYWIEILAVFPFYLVFRGLELLRLGEGVADVQRTAHEVSLLRETELIREVRFAREARVASEELRFVREARFGQRLLGVIWARLHLAHCSLHVARKKK